MASEFPNEAFVSDIEKRKQEENKETSKTSAVKKQKNKKNKKASVKRQGGAPASNECAHGGEAAFVLLKTRLIVLIVKYEALEEVFSGALEQAKVAAAEAAGGDGTRRSLLIEGRRIAGNATPLNASFVAMFEHSHVAMVREQFFAIVAHLRDNGALQDDTWYDDHPGSAHTWEVLLRGRDSSSVPPPSGDSSVPAPTRGELTALWTTEEMLVAVELVHRALRLPTLPNGSSGNLLTVRVAIATYLKLVDAMQKWDALKRISVGDYPHANKSPEGPSVTQQLQLQAMVFREV
jgi:hypothetical protein